MVNPWGDDFGDLIQGEPLDFRDGGDYCELELRCGSCGAEYGWDADDICAKCGEPL